MTAAAFWSRVNKQGPLKVKKLGRCWPWTGALDKDGYGSVREGPNGRRTAAHRVACKLAGKPLRKGQHGAHRCDNPPCCRPSHIMRGTQEDNILDMVRKGRQTNADPMALWL